MTSGRGLKQVLIVMTTTFQLFPLLKAQTIVIVGRSTARLLAPRGDTLADRPPVKVLSAAPVREQTSSYRFLSARACIFLFLNSLQRFRNRLRACVRRHIAW